jgi:type I restriction enzyme S subunit
MKYQAYPKYKDSGVEWLGNVPEHWAVSKIKFIAPYQVGWTPPTKNDANFDGENLWANISDLRGKIIHDTAKKISDEAAKAASMDITPGGSLLYSFKLSVGAVSFAGKDMYTNEAIASFLEGATLPLSYLYYVLPKFVIENASTNIYGARILNQELISNAMLLAPSFQEAEKIANFLDHETAQIDTLIEKQQQLIKLLKEKRQAVISHAVTKGLNPNAPMRDSGVEWLGEVPEHWEVVPLKHIANIKYGIGEPPKYTEEGISLIRATNIRSGKISNINLVFVNPDDIPANRIIWLEVGDIIVVRSGAGTGDSSIIPKEYEGSIAGFDMVVKPIKCIPTFLGHALLSNYVRDNQMDLEKARAAQPHLNAEELGGCFILLPPKKEQGEIDQYLMRELSKFDLLMRQVDKASVLLQERRTALISAAVTGKIDVRNWQAPEPLYSNKETHKEEAA